MHMTWATFVTIWFGFEILVRIAAFFVVPRNRKPTSATAWLLIIMLSPTLGLIAFLLIGSPKLSKKRRADQDYMDTVLQEAVLEAKNSPDSKKFIHDTVDTKYQPFVSLNNNLGKLPAFSGNSVQIISEYNDILKSIAADIQSAKSYVHIEFFICVLDEETEVLFAAMEAAAHRGVKVRVMFDQVGNIRFPNSKKMKQRMTQAGIEWHAMLPLRLPGKSYTRPDLRNHRKIVVIDGNIGYTGSLNIIKRNYHRKDALYYDELMVRVCGPVVTQLHGVFITDWYAETGELLSRKKHPEITFTPKSEGDVLAQVLPSGPGYEFENNLKLFNSLIYSAQKRVVITNPYFVPDESLLAAVVTAAQRGVEVIMLNSDIIDQKMVGHAQRSFYEQLLVAGVKIYWYPWPILLHSKHLTIDDEISVIGSSNFDIRSFQLDLEVSLVVYDQATTKDLHKIENIYISRSKLVKLSDWHKRPQRSKLLDNLARLTSALQ